MTGYVSDEKPFTGSSIPPVALAVAIDQSKLSLCSSKRGVAVWAESSRGEPSRVIGRGFNKNTGLHGCLQTAACKSTCRSFAIHAEQVALMDSLWNDNHVHGRAVYMVHVKTVNGKLQPSGPPSCVECSKLIVSSPMRIKGVYLYHEQGWHYYNTVEFHKLSMENDSRTINRTASVH